MTSDQLHWDRAYEAQQQPELQSQPSDFAVAVADQLGHEDIVLELGCGAGIDAAYLAARVRSITAVDFAEKQIQLNQATLKQPNLTFTALDITRDLNRFPDASYSAVYARRSLDRKSVV